MPTESKKKHEEKPVVSTISVEPEEQNEKGPAELHERQSNKTRMGGLNSAVDVWGKIIIGIAGLWLGYLLNNQQKQVAVQIGGQQQQIAREAGEVQKSQVAASLIDSLIKGSEKEKLLALKALEHVDRTLWQEFSLILAQHDPDATVRQQAIEGLGRKGEGTVRQTLVTIQEQGKTLADREEAKQATANLTNRFRDNLSKARAFYGIGQWQSAAGYFYEASKQVSESQVDGSKLAIARSHYEHGGYQDAARVFNDLFSKF